MRGRDVQEGRHRDDPAELDGAFQRWDGLHEVAATEGDHPEAPVADDEARRMIDLAGDPAGLVGARLRLREFA